MEFLLQNRDPLISLLLFFVLVFIISFFSYWWAVFKVKSQKSELERFLDSFSANADKDLKTLLSKEDANTVLRLLAQAFEKSGDYEKAIAIYLHLKKSSLQDQLTILRSLGDLYFKAGFLSRSKDIYEEILKIVPREKEVLKKLLIVYEKIGDLEGCLEIVSILEVLEGFCEEKSYFLAKKAINEEDKEALIQLYEQDMSIVRVVFEYLFQKDPSLAWRAIRQEDMPKIIDILWYLPKDPIKANNSFLKELYSAKGYIEEAKRSEIFELDLLLHYKKADLDFEYVCSACKQVLPFAFNRCPVCYSVKPAKVELIVTKRRDVDEKSIAF